MAKNFNKPKKEGKKSIEEAKKAVSVDTSEYMRFSLKYYLEQGDKFSIKGKQEVYFRTLIERMRDLSRMKMSAFLSDRSNTLRSHPIDWNDVTEDAFGIPAEEQLVSEPYQFALSANAHGRVHGFHIDNTFFIVWLDPDHNLYA